MNSRQLFVFLFSTFASLVPTLVIVGMFLLVFALVSVARRAKTSDTNFRIQMEPLAVWDYSPDEWQNYAKLYDLAKFPKGAARVSITLLDVWIIDDGEVRRKILADTRKCMTACRFVDQIMKLRVRSWACPYRSGRVVYSVEDFSFPIPLEKTEEAIKIERLFNENIISQSEKVASVMPEGFTGTDSI